MYIYVCIYISLPCWSYIAHAVSATPLWRPWRCTAQQSLEENLLGRRQLVDSLHLLHLQIDCTGAKAMTDSAGARSLTIPVLFGAALVGRLCSGAPPTVWQRLSQEGHLSPKLLLPIPPPCRSPFLGVRPALWSEGSPHLLLLCLLFIFHGVTLINPLQSNSTLHLLQRTQTNASFRSRHWGLSQLWPHSLTTSLLLQGCTLSVSQLGLTFNCSRSLPVV